MQQSAEAFKYLFDNFSTYIKMDSSGITAGDETVGAGLTKLTSSGIVHIDDATGLNPIQYHYWSQVGTHTFTNAFDIVDFEIQLDSHFKGSQAKGIASISKMTCEGMTSANWVASYISNVNTNTLTATISGQANYRDMANENTQIGGTIIVAYIIIG